MSLTDAQRLAKLQDAQTHLSAATADLDAVIADLQPAPAPAPTPAYLFADDFNGTTGAAPDPLKWVVMVDQKPYKQACYPKAANAFLDGFGHLVLRTKRDSSTPSGFSGAFVGTFLYGRGWPPTTIKASFPVPFHVEMSAKMPAVAGAWPAFWPMSVDRSTAQPIYELDVAEERMTYPYYAGYHQHTWLSGSDKAPWDGLTQSVTDMGKNWHTYAADVMVGGVTYYVDGGEPSGTAYGVSGHFGLLLDNSIALPGSWGSGGAQPPASDPGPWDLLIDHVRVWAL